jgi:hypothetical protein
MNANTVGPLSFMAGMFFWMLLEMFVRGVLG